MDDSWPAAGFKGSNVFQLIRPELDNHFAESWKTSIVSLIMDTTVENTISTFSVYPNPSKGSVSIQALSYDNEIVRVYNITGQLITTSQLDGVGMGQLDLTGQKRGVYIIKIAGVSKKLILMN